MYRNAPRLRTSAELRESPKSGCQYDIKGELNLTSEFSNFQNHITQQYLNQQNK